MSRMPVQRAARMLPIDDVCAATNFLIGSNAHDVAILGRSVFDQNGGFEDIEAIIENCDFSGKRYIIFPILKNGHFTSVTVDLEERTITHADSLGDGFNLPDKLADIFNARFDYGDDTPDFTYVWVPQQERLTQGSDLLCGFHAILNGIMGSCDFAIPDHRDFLVNIVEKLFGERVDLGDFQTKGEFVSALQPIYNALNYNQRLAIEARVIDFANQNRQKLNQAYDTPDEEGKYSNFGQILPENIRLNKVYGFIDELLRQPNLDPSVRRLCQNALVQRTHETRVANALMMQYATSNSVGINPELITPQHFYGFLQGANNQILAMPFLHLIDEFIYGQGGSVDKRNIPEFIARLAEERAEAPDNFAVRTVIDENTANELFLLGYNAIHDHTFPDRVNFIRDILVQSAASINASEFLTETAINMVIELLNNLNEAEKKEFLKNTLENQAFAAAFIANPLLEVLKDFKPLTAEDKIKIWRDKKPKLNNNPRSCFTIDHDPKDRELIISAKSNDLNDSVVTAENLCFLTDPYDTKRSIVVGDYDLGSDFNPYYARFSGLVFDETNNQRIFGNANIFMASFQNCYFDSVDFSAIPSSVVKTLKFVECTFKNCKGLDIDVMKANAPQDLEYKTVRETANAMKAAVADTPYDSQKFKGSKVSDEEMKILKKMLQSQGIDVVKSENAAQETSLRDAQKARKKSSVDHAFERLNPSSNVREPTARRVQVFNDRELGE